MKYCRHCGKEVADEAIFCPGCGCATDVYNQQMQQPAAPQKQGEQLSTMSIIGFVFAFISCIVGLICSIIAYKSAVAEDNKKSKSFSLAGIVISSVSLALAILALVLLIVLLIIGFSTAPHYDPCYPYNPPYYS